MKYAIALSLMLYGATALHAAEPVPQAGQARLEASYQQCLNSLDTNLACIAAGR